MSDAASELESKLLAPCGMYCGFCPYFKGKKSPHCSGCFSKKGHQFWGGMQNIRLLR